MDSVKHDLGPTTVGGMALGIDERILECLRFAHSGSEESVTGIDE
jgi:hypothetical protein